MTVEPAGTRMSLLCLECARVGLLGAAVFMSRSRAVCAAHCVEPLGWSPDQDADDSLLWCLVCARDGRAHRAYVVSGGLSLCIRHGAEDLFPNDDMSAHNLAHAAYLNLQQQGVADRY